MFTSLLSESVLVDGCARASVSCFVSAVAVFVGNVVVFICFVFCVL